jgi:hypothetical protein
VGMRGLTKAEAEYLLRRVGRRLLDQDVPRWPSGGSPTRPMGERLARRGLVVMLSVERANGRLLHGAEVTPLGRLALLCHAAVSVAP